MTNNGIKVLNYLKSNFPNEKTKKEIITATGLTQAQVQAALTGFGSLKRMGLLDSRVETIEIEPAVEATEDTRGRKAKNRNIYYFVLNADGLAFEPDMGE